MHSDPNRSLLAAANNIMCKAVVGMAMACLALWGSQVPRVQAQTPTENGHLWKNVIVGGAGCWVTGVFVHPTSKTTYIRTDVGGAFRWDSGNSRWIPLSDGFTYTDNKYYGVESMALDPQQPNWVYMAAGTYTDGDNGAVFKSTDKGTTWTKLGLGVPMGGNESGRMSGERLAVSPSNSNVLLFGSRTQGLHRTADGGLTWTKTNLPTAANEQGVVALAFNPGIAGRAYAAVSGSGVYVSADNGVTWNVLSGGAGPTSVRRLVVGSDNDVWVTYGSGVAKYESGTWYYREPDLNVTSGYYGIAVDPSNANTIIVSDGDAFTFNDGSSSTTGRLYRSQDNGQTWAKLPAARTKTVSWDYNRDVINVSALAFGSNSNQLWAANWAGIGRIDDLNASTLNLVSYEVNHEQSVCTMLATPSSGSELLSAFLDLDGFNHDNGLDQYPSKRFGLTSGAYGHTMSVAYQGDSPSNLMRTIATNFSGANPGVAVSSDGGDTWNRLSLPSTSHIPLQGVIATSNTNNMVVMCNGTGVTNPWLYTNNKGTSWSTCAGIPASEAPTPSGIFLTMKNVAADLKNPNTIYVYTRASGKIYRSTNGGASFTHVNSASPLPSGMSYQLKSPPDVAWHLWAGFTTGTQKFPTPSSSTTQGLWRSTSGGETWTRIPGVHSVVNFAFGKPPAGSTIATLYLYGRLDGDTSDWIYRSFDRGANWERINDANNRVGSQPQTMEASQQVFGRVFIGTNGRGIFYGDDLTVPGDGTGLRGKYHDNIDFTGATQSRTDATVNFDWGTGSPINGISADTFSVRWDGRVQARQKGDYIFRVTGDDGVRLWINGVQVITTGWKNQGPTAYDTAPIYFGDGQKQNIVLDMYDSAYSSMARLEWKRPGQSTFEVVPQTQLYPASGTDSAPVGNGNGLTGRYYSSSSAGQFSTFIKSQTDPRIDFDWGTDGPLNTDGTTMSSVGPDLFAVRWTGQVQAIEAGTYTFSTVTDDGVRLWLGDTSATATPIIDHWVNQGATRYSYSMTLAAGQRIDLKMEYYDSAYAAMAQLEWIRPGQTATERDIIPQSQLYPSSAAKTVVRMNGGQTTGTPPTNWFLDDAARNANGDVIWSYSTTSTINVTATNAAPTAVYQVQRGGPAIFSIPVASGYTYTVRLHFADIQKTGASQRKFNVDINDVRKLSDFDIVAAAGAGHKAVVRDFTGITSDNNGNIVVALNYGSADSPAIAGIEIF
jgi:photosystem II stability/assembly factor-like uncharacterized protein